MNHLGKFQGWARLGLVLAFTLLTAEKCAPTTKAGGGNGSGDPIQGKFAVLGRATGLGFAHVRPDGRSFQYSLVKGEDKTGVYFYVTNDPDGKFNPSSVRVPTPNYPFVFDWNRKTAVLLTTTGSSLHFESVEASLEGSNFFVEQHVKVPGNTGHGAALLAPTVTVNRTSPSFTSDRPDDRYLVTVTTPVAVDPDPNGRELIRLKVTKSLSGGVTHYRSDADRNSGTIYLSYPEAPEGEFGVELPTGVTVSESGPRYFLTP